MGKKFKLEELMVPEGVITDPKEPIKVSLGDIEGIKILELFYVRNNTSTDGCFIKAEKDGEVIYLRCTFDAMSYYDFFKDTEEQYCSFQKYKIY